MGKGEDNSAEEVEEKTADSTTGEKVDTTEKEVEKADRGKESSEEKKDTESLRKVIKVDQPDKTAEEKEEKTVEPIKEEKPKEKQEEKVTNEEEEPSGREALEQKRAILQNIKDFDFQIKKNQEDIGGVHKKLESMSKDLDDLVSLYEIVSEQMNPFVGLSKVTKKRLDALENFTREIEALKDRTGELESFAERSGAKIQSLGQVKQEVKTIDADALIAKMDEKLDEDKQNKPDVEKTDESKSDVEKKEPKIEAVVETKEKPATGEELPPEQEPVQTDSAPEQKEESKPIQTPHDEVTSPPIQENEPDFSEESFDDAFFGEISSHETFESTPVYVSPQIDSDMSDELFDIDLDMIFEMAFGSSDPAEGKIDMIIDEFIESLKGQNVN